MSKRSRVTVAAVIATAAMTLAACGGSSGGSTSSGGTKSAASGQSYKIGVLADVTGAYSSATASTEGGIKAYVNYVNASGGVNGHKLSYVVEDTASTATGAITAAHLLVQREKVFAVIANSGFSSSAEPYLLQQHIPTFGGGWDGEEWSVPSNTNLFAATGTLDLNAVNPALGQFMKAQGVTSCASIGWNSGSAAPSAIAGSKSCTAAGLKSGYLNAEVPTGSTDVGPIAIAIKNAHADGVYLATGPNTAFALLAALKALHVNLKASLVDAGYGGDLLASKPTVATSQGYEFLSIGKPTETNDSATKLQADNFTKVGVSLPPTFAQQESYLSMAALVAGLKAAGANATQATLTSATRNIHNFDGDGLLSPGTVDFSNFSQTGASGGAAGCMFIAQLKGSGFVVVPGTPVCGGKLPGVTVK